MTAATVPTELPTAAEVDHLSERTAHVLAGRIAEQILDVVSRRRPLHQVRRRLSGPVAGLLTALARREPQAYRLRSIHACVTSANKIEACAVIGNNSRAKSLALRLERANMVWSCTMFALV